MRDAGREPVTIDEGVSAAVLHPGLLRERHAFSILASHSIDKAVAKASRPYGQPWRPAPRLVLEREPPYLAGVGVVPGSERNVTLRMRRQRR